MAEKLCKLPLSFFGKKDLSELTITIMGDCTDLERTFSHSVPQLFGSLISITLVGIGLFAVNWKMALSAIFVFPLAIFITVGSKFLQDKMGRKKIEANLAASDKAGTLNFITNGIGREILVDMKNITLENMKIKEVLS